MGYSQEGTSKDHWLNSREKLRTSPDFAPFYCFFLTISAGIPCEVSWLKNLGDDPQKLEPLWEPALKPTWFVVIQCGWKCPHLGWTQPKRPPFIVDFPARLDFRRVYGPIQPRFGMIRHNILGPFRDLEVDPIDGEIVQKHGKRNRVE